MSNIDNTDDDYDLKNQMEEALERKLRSRLNDDERMTCNEHFFNTYPIRFGSICCYHCRKTLQQLKEHWEASQLINGRSTVRVRPYLTIQEKNGRGVDSIDPETKEIIPFGNVEWACFSCQQFFFTKNDPIMPDSKSSYQARKGKPVRRAFKIRLTNHLAKEYHICYKAMINKWSGDTMFDCSQDLLESAFDTYLDVIWKFVDVDEVIPEPEECGYGKCNHKHVILINKNSKNTKTDYDVFLEEQGTTDI